jgi:hypothetical protein
MKKQLLKLSLVLTAVLLLGQVVKAQLSENYEAPVATIEVPKVIVGGIEVDAVAETSYSDVTDMESLQNDASLITDWGDYGAPDGAASFQIAYSMEALYVFMNIIDDKGHFVNESDWGNPWQFDCVEIFTDATWAEGEDAYGNDATQNRFCRVGQDEVPEEYQIQLHANLGDAAADVEHAWADDGPTDTEVQFEVSFPWAGVLGGGVITDFNDGLTELGFEISYIDSDGDPGTVGSRKAIIFWDADDEDGLADGTAYQNTAAFGVMTLQDIVSVKQTELNSSDLSYSVDGRTITFNQEVSVYNTLGQLVGQGKIVTVENAGIYIVNGIKLAVK